ncbi:MAG: 50S ribosomal protein L23 [Anaerolineae bacterium]|nr:50S ribosomal protein L23 [Anaerolineae bacterium]
MNPYQVIIRPLDTEKSRYQSTELRQYAFEVHRRANKIDVKRAIETIYGVKVASVNVMNMPAKITRRYGRRPLVRRPVWKKALVKLEPGERLEVFEGV